MPDATLDEITDALYATRPDDFVPARDDAVAHAKEQGDKDLARAIARLRRPTKAAWLANLLARHRAEQLDGLLALAGDLADAQRTLDGTTLRALSSQRSRLVSAMAKEAGRLASQAGDSAAESVLRDVAGILEAALADPAVAEEVRAGRLSRTVSYSGFGPAAEPGTVPPRPRPRPAPAEPAEPAEAAADEAAPDEEAAEQARAREQAERERAERDRAVEEAERDEAQARDRQETDEAARDDAEAEHADAKARVAALTAELDAARERERTASAAARAAASAARDSARAAGAAATVAARARARRDELD